MSKFPTACLGVCVCVCAAPVCVHLGKQSQTSANNEAVKQQPQLEGNNPRLAALANVNKEDRECEADADAAATR